MKGDIVMSKEKLDELIAATAATAPTIARTAMIIVLHFLQHFLSSSSFLLISSPNLVAAI